ncbi:hypothetical protein [uncultured Prevotellamassilia sp.]|uniref:hypothetical protein n=1 Tax=uncultured Prevotellamassilia sp. TaxID=1926676 RepID=UPI0025865B67|nr:hypothetical protein [uncultured Prevotellamassilia sp.]
MIDIKVIKKPKNEGSTSALRTGGTAYGGMAVKEAAHAAKADLAEVAKEAVHATDSDHAVNADEAKHALEADHAKEADNAANADKWDYREFDDYLNQPVRKTDGVTFDSVTSDSIRSAGQFVDGLLGAGFQLWKGEDGRTYLTVDKLTVRQTMAVMELLIEKVRSVGGQICVSAANGRIKTVEKSGERYLITFEQENMFVQHDLVRCQTFTGKDMRSYWVEVADVGNGGIVVAKEEFEGVVPKVGDDCVLMGNTANTDRQNMVLISATEDGQPRVDVMDGVSGKTFEGALRARFGNLDGIKDEKFPADRQPKGNGLYADNAFLKGTFVLETGEDVKTRFEVTEGKVKSAIDGVRNDIVSDKSYLNNPTFASGLAKWDSVDETVFFLVGNKWVWANGGALSKKGDGASVVTDMGRTVVRIKNKYILQKHGNLRFVPTFPANSDGKKEALPVYLSFFYRCAKAGTLKVGFEGVEKVGFADFASMEVMEALGVTDGYVQYTCSGLWNGTGDFKLSFDGDIYLYMLVLSTDKVDALTYKYKTLFEQSERLVKISAAVFDKDENMLEETGLVTTSKLTGMYAIDGDGNLKSFVGAGQDGVKIKASNIQLEGLVTANKNFMILEDGSIVTKNATIYGKVYVDNGGKVGGFEIENGCLKWGDGQAEIRLGYNTSFGGSCVYIKANMFSNAIAGLAPMGGSGIYGSCRVTPTFPDLDVKCAGYFDGDVIVNAGNILVKKGDIQADRILPQNGWSGEFKGKATVTVQNGIIINVS